MRLIAASSHGQFEHNETTPTNRTAGFKRSKLQSASVTERQPPDVAAMRTIVTDVLLSEAWTGPRPDKRLNQGHITRCAGAGGVLRRGRRPPRYPGRARGAISCPLQSHRLHGGRRSVRVRRAPRRASARRPGVRNADGPHRPRRRCEAFIYRPAAGSRPDRAAGGSPVAPCRGRPGSGVSDRAGSGTGADARRRTGRTRRSNTTYDTSARRPRRCPGWARRSCAPCRTAPFARCWPRPGDSRIRELRAWRARDRVRPRIGVAAGGRSAVCDRGVRGDGAGDRGVRRPAAEVTTPPVCAGRSRRSAESEGCADPSVPPVGVRFARPVRGAGEGSSRAAGALARHGGRRPRAVRGEAPDSPRRRDRKDRAAAGCGRDVGETITPPARMVRVGVAVPAMRKALGGEPVRRRHGRAFRGGVPVPSLSWPGKVTGKRAGRRPDAPPAIPDPTRPRIAA